MESVHQRGRLGRFWLLIGIALPCSREFVNKISRVWKRCKMNASEHLAAKYAISFLAVLISLAIYFWILKSNGLGYLLFPILVGTIVIGNSIFQIFVPAICNRCGRKVINTSVLRYVFTRTQMYRCAKCETYHKSPRKSRGRSW